MADENCSKTLKLPKTQACAPATNQYRCDAKNGQSAGRRRARRTDEAVAAAPNDSVCTARRAARPGAEVRERREHALRVGLVLLPFGSDRPRRHDQTPMPDAEHDAARQHRRRRALHEPTRADGAS